MISHCGPGRKEERERLRDWRLPDDTPAFLSLSELCFWREDITRKKSTFVCSARKVVLSSN